jgi:hypothetical protein
MNKLKSLLAGLTIFALTAPVARAEVVTVNEMFGGEDVEPEDFANAAGLGSADLTTTIANIIRVGLGFLGVVAVAIVLVGGFKWVTAGGDDEKVKKAKKYIFQGIAGLIIVLAAYAIATFALGAITEAMSE